MLIGLFVVHKKTKLGEVMEGQNNLLAGSIVEHMSFVEGKLSQIEARIKSDRQDNIKDLADYHRYAETLMFLGEVRRSLEHG